MGLQLRSFALPTLDVSSCSLQISLKRSHGTPLPYIIFNYMVNTIATPILVETDIAVANGKRVREICGQWRDR